MKTIGFIGTGNMGSALARAVAQSEIEADLLYANRTAAKAQKLAKEIGGTVTDNVTIAKEADIIFLGVKPQYLEDVYKQIITTIEYRRPKPLLISMMAGYKAQQLSEMFVDCDVIRIMPNMPVSIGCGYSFYCCSRNVQKPDVEYFRELLKYSGTLKAIDEKLLDAATGITGCGPAFTAMFVEALADGAVACGVPRNDAYLYAAEMLKGTAEYLLKTGCHPAVLKDNVCSPGGSTIQGVRKLEEKGFRSAVSEALIATRNKKF